MPAPLELGTELTMAACRRSLQRLALLLGGLALSGVGWCAAPDGNPVPAAAGAAVLSYADATDEELTALGARWGELDSEQRRALLAEVKMRMARAGRQGTAKGVLHIRLRHRYGAVPPTVGSGRLRIRILQGEQAEGTQQFGVGFEQRKGARPGPAAEQQPAAGGALKAADSD